MKTRTNVSIDSALLKEARLRGLVLSHVLESALKKEFKKAAEKEWIESNAQSISAYNDYLDANGVFSDESRSF